VEYNAARTSATVEIRVLHKDGLNSFTYYFDGVAQSSPSKTFGTSFTKTLTLSAVGSDGSKVTVGPIDFVWNAPTVSQAAQFNNGQKGAIVELFGWPHNDVAQECAAIGKMGYLGVKVFPVMEQVMSDQPFNNILNPW
jgi:alpha-amylase